MLRPDSFPLTPELFAQLDKNKDGRIKREEFSVLNEVPPHVVIAAEFGRVQGSGSGFRRKRTGTEERDGDRSQMSRLGRGGQSAAAAAHLYRTSPSQ